MREPQILHHIYINFTWCIRALQLPHSVMIHKENKMDGPLSCHWEL